MNNANDLSVHNLDMFDFNKWVEFIFDHPVINNPALSFKEKNWYCHDEWKYSFNDDSKQAENCIRLFENPSFLHNKYSWEQIDEGFWFLLFEIATYLVREVKIPWSNRMKLIESMKTLFEKSFVHNPINLCGFMWWDELCYSYYTHDGIPEDEDDKNVQNTIFLTLKKIIKIDSLTCQISALHGLGHIKLKEAEPVIREYLKEHPDLSKRVIDYAEGCITGTMDRIGDPLRNKIE